jgi:elongation factor P
MKANEIKPGVAINLSGKLYVVVKTEHVKPGKGPAYIQAKMRGVDGSGMKEQRFNSSDNVEGATLDRREMEFLFPDGSGGGTFMDTSDYDQIEVGRTCSATPCSTSPPTRRARCSSTRASR